MGLLERGGSSGVKSDIESREVPCTGDGVCCARVPRAENGGAAEDEDEVEGGRVLLTDVECIGESSKDAAVASSAT